MQRKNSIFYSAGIPRRRLPISASVCLGPGCVKRALRKLQCLLRTYLFNAATTLIFARSPVQYVGLSTYCAIDLTHYQQHPVEHVNEAPPPSSPTSPPRTVASFTQRQQASPCRSLTNTQRRAGLLQEMGPSRLALPGATSTPLRHSTFAPTSTQRQPCPC